MDNNYRSRFLLAALLLLLILGCGGCSGKTGGGGTSLSYEPGKTQVLVPSADGDSTVGGDPLLLDFSHADEGYFMGILKQADKKVNIQVIGPDNVTYKYFLETPNVYTTFPFTAGSGRYMILAFENIGGDMYSSLFNHALDIELKSDFLPFLYPNQFVDFTEGSEAVKKAEELSKNAKSDVDALSGIFNYITSSITYDKEKAQNVQIGYLPNIDETLRTGEGICFDYASLTVAMLRSLSIPARLDIGYSGVNQHAWVTVYIESVGWVENAIEFNGDEWKLIDPTFVSSADDIDDVIDYIGDGENYTIQYVR